MPTNHGISFGSTDLDGRFHNSICWSSLKHFVPTHILAQMLTCISVRKCRSQLQSSAHHGRPSSRTICTTNRPPRQYGTKGNNGIGNGNTGTARMGYWHNKNGNWHWQSQYGRKCKNGIGNGKTGTSRMGYWHNKNGNWHWQARRSMPEERLERTERDVQSVDTAQGSTFQNITELGQIPHQDSAKIQDWQRLSDCECS